MECPYPHCAGTLRTSTVSGFCTLCRLPVSTCAQCGAANRAFAVFCRQCGRAGSVWRGSDPVDPAALRCDPRRTTVPQQVTTLPQAAAGFVWAMGEGGDLYRLNPYAPSGEQLEVHDRFWAQAQSHAFTVGRLRAPFGQATPDGWRPQEEECAVVATADRVLLSGLFSKQRRSLLPVAGETFLVNSRDEYQFVAAHRDSLFALARYAEQISLCHVDLNSGEVRRFAVAHGDTALCGPALLTEGDHAHPVIWSATGLWVYTNGDLTPVALPEAVELWTAPAETGLRLPPGRSPAIAGAGHVFFAARQFGRPALLRLARGLHGWSTTVIAVLDEGTLGESTAGDALLSTAGKLLACTGPGFRTVVQDHQIAPRFPAWAHAGLTLFFCEADYRGLKQWLKATAKGAEVPVGWDLAPGAEVHACHSFSATGTALSSVCVLAERGLRTEFLSWCV